MANFTGGYILTQKGEALQAQVEAGKLPLNLTKFQIGNGNAGSMQEYYTRDSLVHPLNNLTIASKEAKPIEEPSVCILKATLVNNAVESGYMAYEMGLFALDSDGNEILFAVIYDGNPSYIVSKDDGTEITMNFEFILMISEAEKINLTMPMTVEELAAMGQDKAIAAADSATAAAKSATSAADHETAAKVAQGKAEDAQAGAEVAQKAVATSATAAASSASSAASSAATASTKAANASASATAAANSASAAATSATAAKNSQTAAASSASAAASAASTAATHETNAKTALASCQNIQSQVNSGLQALTSAVKYRGSVASYAALPTTGLSTGDMYNVRAAGGTDANGTAIKAGDNLVYNGSGWDDQSGTVDLSNYYTKTEMAGAVMSTTVSNDTITFIHKDATKTTAKVNNVAHATAATSDDKGQAIDIAALKTLITTTVNAGITSALQKVFPVGSIYTSLTDSRNPNAILGFGTWEALPAGYTLIAQGSGTDEYGSFTYTAGQKYGERKHPLTTDELPKIKGDAQFRLINMDGNIVGDINDNQAASGAFSYVKSGGSKWEGTMQLGNSATRNTDVLHLGFGGNQPHNNLPPSISCYGWRRTA